jgi:hypothetical protein
MSAGVPASSTPADIGPPPEASIGGLPRPPIPRPLAPTPAAPATFAPLRNEDMSPVPATIAEDVTPPMPPVETPEQFKVTARRAFRQLSQLAPSEKRVRLLTAYLAFVEAVRTNAPDLEDIGDQLDDASIDAR